jgi:hypothetical protein
MFANEAFRLLKPSGRFVRADGFLATNDMTPNEKKIFSEWCEGWAVPGLETVNEYEKILKDAGFINIKCSVITPKIMKSAIKMWWSNAPFYLPFRLLYKIKLLHRENYMDVLASLHQKKLFSKEITKYILISAEKP